MPFAARLGMQGRIIPDEKRSLHCYVNITRSSMFHFDIMLLPCKLDCLLISGTHRGGVMQLPEELRMPLVVGPLITLYLGAEWRVG